MFRCLAIRFFAFVGVVSLLSGWPATAQESQDRLTEAGGGTDATSVVERPREYMGRPIARTMSFHGANWLIRDSREREEDPKQLLRALNLQPGQRVCDFGCGNGYYALQIAQAVAPDGVVVAVDIQQEMLDLLQQRSKPRGLDNIRPVLAGEKDPQLPAGKLDLVLMVDVYHELSYPAEVLAAIHAKLAPLGRIALVEYREEDPEVPIRPRHKMSQPQALKEFTANHFKLVGQFDELPWQHVLFFARSDSSLPSVQLVAWRPLGGVSTGPNDDRQTPP